MDTFTLISKLAEFLAWPIAAIVICIVLKTPIDGLLKRLTKAKHKDTELDFGAEIQSSSITIEGRRDISHAIPPDPLGLVTEAEGRIYESLNLLNVNSEEEKVRVLAKHHASLQIRSAYNEIYFRIFGSQILLLQALNNQSEHVEERFFKTFYESAKKENPEFYSQYSFESYVNFLKAVGLINLKSDKYFLTTLGRGFLIHIAEFGLDIKRPY